MFEIFKITRLNPTSWCDVGKTRRGKWDYLSLQDSLFHLFQFQVRNLSCKFINGKLFGTCFGWRHSDLQDRLHHSERNKQFYLQKRKHTGILIPGPKLKKLEALTRSLYYNGLQSHTKLLHILLILFSQTLVICKIQFKDESQAIQPNINLEVFSSQLNSANS
ncbi:Hypothetical_protein [Hexamita inflata]|uniref:Hypothetical_protein n=1 Tax=Hexamita inflata TaxID=28002 RepID=A0AA86RA77_9EUKA|nr:Hypothetical protein HINF_LOCUS58573 [Hexamita inflata]